MKQALMMGQTGGSQQYEPSMISNSTHTVATSQRDFFAPPLLEDDESYEVASTSKDNTSQLAKKREEEIAKLQSVADAFMYDDQRTKNLNRAPLIKFQNSKTNKLDKSTSSVSSHYLTEKQETSHSKSSNYLTDNDNIFFMNQYPTQKQLRGSALLESEKHSAGTAQFKCERSDSNMSNK